MRPLRLPLLVLLALQLRCAASIYTFGSGDDGCSQNTPYCNARHACAGVSGGHVQHGAGAHRNIPVLNYTLRPGALLGVMDHFWWCSSPGELALAQQGLRAELRYFVDGEAEASVVYEPAMSVGQAFAATTLAGEWYSAQSQVGDGSTLFSAGSKMGRSGVGGGGWWHRHPVLFQKSIRIEIGVVEVANASRVFGNASGLAPPLPTFPPPGCVQATAVVRGYERSTPFKTAAGVVLPLEARMRVQRIESQEFAPREFVPLATIPAGHQGLMHLLTFSTATRPWTRCTSADCKSHQTENNYVEGCWHLLRTHDEQLPGLITGTGLEDGLDSQYGFSIINYPEVQQRNPTGLNRECSAGPAAGEQGQGNFTVCKKQGLQWQSPNTGMLTFMSDYSQISHPDPIEKLSVYRFFDDEVFAWEQGGTFGWHNVRSAGLPWACRREADSTLCARAQGAFGSTGATTPTGYGGKCWDPDPERQYGACGTSSGTCPTTVRSQAWYFMWPNSSSATFA